MKILKSIRFSNDIELCEYVNKIKCEVVTIVYRDYQYILFYYE